MICKFAVFKQFLRPLHGHRLITIACVSLLITGTLAGTVLLSNRHRQFAPTLASAKKTQTQNKHQENPSLQAAGAINASPTQASSITSTLTTKNNTSKSSNSESSSSLNFTLSTNSVTIQQGASTPTITARTTDGLGANWIVAAPLAQQSYMSVIFGITGGPGPTASDSFAISTNPTETQPGTYTGTVTAYPSGNVSAGVAETFTITVLPQPTFIVVPFTPTNNFYSQNDEDCLNFTLQWTLPPGTSPQAVTATAYVAGISPTDKVISINITGSNGCILVQFGSVPENNNEVRFVVSDATYSANGSIYYSVH